MKPLALILLPLVVTTGYAQLTGKITVEAAGIEFTIPEGWIGQQTEVGYVLGSQTEAGAIILTNHESTSVEALKQEAIKGINEEGGTQLNIDGAPESLSQNSIGGVFHGMVQGQAVKAYVVGLINPHGRGITILALTTPEMFNERHQHLAKEIAKGVRFFKPVTGPIIAEWKAALTNARLTYLASYNTNDGGYSDKIVIDLCGTGSFNYSRNYSMAVDVGAAFGNSSDTGQGSGTWRIISDAAANPVLELKFSNGDVHEYTLQYSNDQTLLNGRRYFRTYDTECK